MRVIMSGLAFPANLVQPLDRVQHSAAAPAGMPRPLNFPKLSEIMELHMTIAAIMVRVDLNKRMVGMLSLGDISHAASQRTVTEVMRAVSALPA
jgi:hypothetical protein